ncbi:FUSC family protein [Mycolicibacterium brumae]|uniref:FUSC family protein n=1 Tax=Mycolicibacterium brumae TaxID=85968 RepID=A0A2G5PFV0_9MYCO|nr:FUSC family protein [Mycolicibacterium brumae]MCV7194419.1 FUSC family protein [Mycolicibacterium brumae]PIB77195.1 FUSC family protein [Mycolicibacterium brumae]RWA15430.1 hypothetical protein MBRU_10295 [Mycolicibacterium brumae DSM 44177]UWW10543.1 FUSC family protein [Mycolicibacterium brumae]
MRAPRPIRRLRAELSERDPEYDAQRRAARVALVIPLAAALGFTFGEGQTPMFAIFGTIAQLIMVDFPGNRARRAVSYLGLGAAGAVMIVLGTLVSPIPWLAVATMFVVASAVTFAGVLSSSIAAARRAALMPFVLPACTPPGPLDDRLLGWAIAVAVCVPAALFLFPPRQHNQLRQDCARVCAALADRLEGHGSAKAVNTAMNALYARYLAGEYRPVGLTAGSRALVRVVDDLGWLADRVDDATAATLGSMAAPAVRVLRASQQLLSGPQSARDPSRVGPRLELADATDGMREVSRGRYRDDIAAILRAPDDHTAVVVGRRLLQRRSVGAQIGVTGRLISWADAADSRPVLARVLGRGLAPAGAAGRVLSETEAVTGLPSGYLSGRSVVVRNSLRTGLGLALAVAVTHLFPVEHGFWVVLAAMSVLRGTALSTGTKVLHAVIGTTLGFAIGAVAIEFLGVNPLTMWLALPVVAFLAAIVPKLWSYTAGQAAFTMMVLIVFNLIQPTGWQVGLLRIEDILVGGLVGAAVSLLLWPRGSGNAVGRAIVACLDIGAHYLRAAVGRITDNTPADTVAALGYQSLAAGRTLDDGIRQYLSENSDPEARTSLIRETNRAVKLRSAADLIADIPEPPTPGAYPNTRAVLDAYANCICDRMLGYNTGIDLAERFVIALRAESADTRRPISDALPLVTVAANLGELGEI